jgi:prophage regulatory protein
MSENNVTFWRWPKVKQVVGMGRTTVFLLYKDGKFPKPFKISKGSIAWRSDEVMAWMEARDRA